MRPFVPLRPALACAVLAALVGGCSTAGPTVPARTAIVVDVPRIDRPGGESAEWWFRDGAAQAASRGAMAGRAKNVILFVGDGMSLTTVTAARILEGQRAGRPGEENQLAWESFPNTALSKTYNTDTQTPDSAGTMTAMATGVKTRAGAISVGPSAARGDCPQGLAAPLTTLWELAAANGLAAGIVTNTRVTHATPAAAFTHVPHRNWENDTELTPEAVAAGCTDIARQFIDSPHARGLKVLMGGGRGNFMPVSAEDPEYADKRGLRLDGRDLVADWKRLHPDGDYAWNADQLASANGQGPLLALFEPSHMLYMADRAKGAAPEPDLATMTRAAITRLAADPDGYVLLVEGGRIDHAHHEGNAYRALDETIALSDAVRAAMEATSAEDTLILVTADHAHTLSFSGYPVRGNPILGKVREIPYPAGGEPRLASDALGKPYTTLTYANGPGYTGKTDQQPEGPKHHYHPVSGAQPATGRPDLGDVDTEARDYLQESVFPLSNETHGGDDVGIWARGPGSDAVRGTLEQNAIFHLMLQATPRLREAACRAGGCDANGVPVELPKLPAR